ncbi:hypothetical protein HAX54_052143 [Datura stramonium]|uniref:C3H1-type domain-containing protein n=1 Tax=Datura stramonium TaxID=4076 RepID=A0ABS8RRN1_DATST|nr:hypothetical protein [Datura stramonium]
MPPANRYPFTQFPSTCEIPDIPQHQIEVLPKSLTNHYPATQCHSTYENLTAAQCSNQNSQIPANDICMLQYQSNGQNLGIPKHKTQVCSYPPANEKSILEMPHGFEGDLTAAVAAFAQSQEQGSLIDTNLLVELLQNPDQLRKLMNEHGMATSPTTGAASGSKPILLSSTTPRSTADSLDKQIAGNENHKCVADSTVFSRSLEVRNTYERRGTAAMSRPVDLLVPSPRTKPDQVINKPINEYQAPRAGSGPKTIAKSVPLAITKPETSMKSNLANEQGPPPHVGTADVIRSKTLAHPTSNLNLEKIKKLINKYGAPDNVGAKPLVNSELIPSSFSKCDVVLSGADLPTTLQPQLQIMTGSPNAGNTPPFSSMTSPAPVHKDINYYKSLIKHHGENCESAADELLPNASPRDGKTRGPGLLKNLKPNQRSLNSRKRCSFFNTPRGCRNGSSCPFLHDMSGQTRSGGMSNDQGSKRMKVSGKLTSRA